ncbi:hypothetical protein Brms1b_013201 [Colletotrichum noveboracense]|nr:hypothetical protein CBS470a_013144 [Colletotrichum nupharicola]KAJ0299223.1 hypothetical protein Brms1b_013201 [Colletotrichum noveboracense]
MHVFYVSSTGTRVDRWEPEGFVQLDAPELLFNYWRSVGGRECGEYWYPLRVVADHDDGQILEVLWEGSLETSEEPYERMIRVSPELVRHYEDQNNMNAEFSHARSPHRGRQWTAVNGKGQRGVVRKARAKASRERRIKNAL